MSFRGKLLENSKEISSVALLSPACFNFFRGDKKMIFCKKKYLRTFFVLEITH